MKHIKTILPLVLTISRLFGQTISPTGENKILFDEIMTVDSIFFHALNNCDLKTYESFLIEDFEFYHDKGGLTKSRDNEMKSMTVFCGEQRQRQRLRRELIKESVEIYPLDNFGALETGRHLFYLVIDDHNEKIISEAKFTNIWQNLTHNWKLARVISYDHQPASIVSLPDKVLELYVGKYEMSPDRTIVITKGAKLLRAHDGDWSADLYPESETKFYLDNGNVQFEFVKGQKGHVDKISIYENGKRIEEGKKK